MWYGNSERKIKAIFDQAAANKQGKSIIYVDEIDSIAGDRSKQHEASQRILSTILSCMDGMKSNDNVFVLASTNRKDSLDSAILRPGRFSKHIQVDLPDEDDRKEVINVHTEKACQIANNDKLFSNVDINQISKAMDGLSGADIAEIIRRALETKVCEKIAGHEPGPVTTSDILAQVDSYEHKNKA
jgi:transitional endoplasmic reticulum ATPase